MAILKEHIHNNKKPFAKKLLTKLQFFVNFDFVLRNIFHNLSYISS